MTMRRLELPPQAAKKLLSDEQAASPAFLLMKAGVGIAVVGVIAFILAYFYQTALTQAGLPYRQVQASAVFVVFLGWMLFVLCAGRLGISVRRLTYPRLVAILRNEVEQGYDEEAGLRTKVGNSLSGLGPAWTLYPTIFSGDPGKRIPMVAVGPGGVYPIHVVTTDPARKGFIDPLPVLVAAAQELEKRLGHPVQPVVTFLRSKKRYVVSDERVKAYTLPELYAHLEARQVQLTPADIQRIDGVLRELSRLPR